MSIPVDPGVSAPTGDPDTLLAAASWHENLSGFFENTVTTLRYTVGSLTGENWPSPSFTTLSKGSTSE